MITQLYICHLVNIHGTPRAPCFAMFALFSLPLSTRPPRLFNEEARKTDEEEELYVSFHYVSHYCLVSLQCRGPFYNELQATIICFLLVLVLFTSTSIDVVFISLCRLNVCIRDYNLFYIRDGN